MSIDIVVMRLPGDSQGPDIQDSLITDVSVAIQRGRNEIDANSGLDVMDMEAVIRPSLYRGSLVEAHDALRGKAWRGKVSSISFVVENEAETPIVRFTLDKAPQ
jgi:hypothetical protein